MNNKKVLFFAVLALFAATSMFAAGADSYKVESVTGKVQYEATPGTWKNVTVGQELSASTVINTSLNSSLVVAKGGSKVTIKAMQKGTIESLSAGSSVASTGIKKGTSLQSLNVADDVDGTARSVVTASSRASEAKEDIDWDEE